MCTSVCRGVSGIGWIMWMGFHVENYSLGFGSRCAKAETAGLSLNWVTVLITVGFLFQDNSVCMSWCMWYLKACSVSHSCSLIHFFSPLHLYTCSITHRQIFRWFSHCHLPQEFGTFNDVWKVYWSQDQSRELIPDQFKTVQCNMVSEVWMLLPNACHCANP